MKITRKGEVIRKGTWLCAIKFCLWEGYNYGEGGLYLVGKREHVSTFSHSRIRYFFHSFWCKNVSEHKFIRTERAATCLPFMFFKITRSGYCSVLEYLKKI